MDGWLFSNDFLFIEIYKLLIVLILSSDNYNFSAVWNTGCTVIARYKYLNSSTGIARNMDSVRIIDLLVLPWGWQGQVAKKCLIEVDVFALVICISN